MATMKPVYAAVFALAAGTASAETWECSEGAGGPVLVRATTAPPDAPNVGKIAVAGTEYVTTYRVDGFDRRWDFGEETNGRFPFRFVIEPNGDARYSGATTQLYSCKISEAEDSARALTLDDPSSGDRPAVDDPVRKDPTENVTVFTDEDGAHVVTLVRETLRETIDQVIKGNELGGVREQTLEGGGGSEALFGVAGAAFAPNYWIRTRVVDGRQICEKFAVRTNRHARDPVRAAEFAAALFKEPCATTEGRVLTVVRPPPKPVPR